MRFVRKSFVAGLAAAAIALGTFSSAWAVDEDVAPTRTITLPASDDYGVAVAPDGTTYVAFVSSGTLYLYAPDAAGAAIPVTTVSGVNQAFFVTYGRDNRVYVGVNGVLPKTYVFAPDGTLLGAIEGNSTTLVGVTDTAVDAQGFIYVLDYAGNQIVVFPPNSIGDVAPVRVIAGQNTGLVYPVGIDVLPDGSIWVTNRGSSPPSIDHWWAGASGDVAPDQRISGVNTTLTSPQDVAVSPITGEIAVSSYSMIAYFDSNATGDASPSHRLIGANTQIVDPWGIAFSSCGQLYVADTNGQISVFGTCVTPTPTPSSSPATATSPTQAALAATGASSNLGLVGLVVFIAGIITSIAGRRSRITR